VTARPTIAKLVEPALFGSGMPIVGAMPADREVMAADLALGRSFDEVIDLRLSGNVMHELCHGLQRETERPPPPWTIVEAAALHLQSVARPAHIFPDVPGEAVPGVAGFVLVGAALARMFGRERLWSVLTGASAIEAFGEGVGEALERRGWDAWLRGRHAEAPFVVDADDAFDWVECADAARSCRWRDEPPGDEDLGMIDHAVRVLFQVNVIAPTYQTHPSDPPSARVEIDLHAGRIAAAVRPEGVAGEPARWVFPPPLARRLEERGARRVIVERAVRGRIAEIVRELKDLVGGGDGALPPEVVLA
jgi:hypothetical protein